MNKIVVNRCFGGYSLSEEAERWLLENGNEDTKIAVAKLGYIAFNCNRHNQDLVKCVEALGEAASGEDAKLEIRHIEGNQYRIIEYDGYESVETPESIQWTTI
jgi:hypothetical protein